MSLSLKEEAFANARRGSHLLVVVDGTARGMSPWTAQERREDRMVSLDAVIEADRRPGLIVTSSTDSADLNPRRSRIGRGSYV